MNRRAGVWAAIAVAIAVALGVGGNRLHSAPPTAVGTSCAPSMNAGFQESLMNRRHTAEGVMICGIVSGRPYERGGEHGLHVYIPVRVSAPGGATYVTQVIPNEELVGRIVVHEGDTIAALGQFVFPNYRAGYEGLIHDTHHATHRGGVDGYVVVNGTVYK